jgi:hypothetical protein
VSGRKKPPPASESAPSSSRASALRSWEQRDTNSVAGVELFESPSNVSGSRGCRAGRMLNPLAESQVLDVEGFIKYAADEFT